jgi:glycosyltransferase involved in cell wall biosynthesis
MRVLFINAREDAGQNPGGDTTQFYKTKAALEGLGLTVEVRDPNQLDNLPLCDVAHVFNIQMPEPAQRVLQVLRRMGMPVVLSSIYWDIYELWFDAAARERYQWKLLSRLLGKPLARKVYIGWQRSKSRRDTQWLAQRSLLQQADRVLPNSKSEAVLLKKTFMLGGDFQGKVDVIPNGIDPALYQETPEPSQAFFREHSVRDFVLEVGMIYPVKNQLGLIEALYDVPIPLVFVGQTQPAFSEYAQTCRDRAAERGNVTFIDRLSHDELPGVYALASVHALPSWRETPGLVSLEAAAAGCRVVTTSIGSTYDYFGDLAWYCYPDDYKSIRKAVESALRAPVSPDLRQRVLSEYTWERAAEATLHAYQKALDGR